MMLLYIHKFCLEEIVHNLLVLLASPFMSVSHPIPNIKYLILICVWDLLKVKDAFPDALFLSELLVLLIVLS